MIRKTRWLPLALALLLPASLWAAQGDVKNAYGSKTTITITLTSLANGSGRESTVIDNTSNKFLDSLIRFKTNGQTSGTGLVDIYIYAALGDTTYTDGATGSDAAFTAANRRNSKYLGSVQMNAGTGVIGGLFSVASAFSGSLPDKWGLIVINNSGATMSATGGDHVIEYEGVFLTVAP